MSEALASGIASAEIILNILGSQQALHHRAPVPDAESLPLKHAPSSDCARYNQLRNRTAEGCLMEAA